MRKIENVDLIIYDLDGVLINSNNAILESFRRTINEGGLNPQPEEKIRGLIGYSLNDIFKILLPKDQHYRIDKIKKTFREHFSELCLDGTFLLDDVVETLRTISERGLIQCIATNKHSELARKILGHLGVLNYFSMIIGATDVANPKPEPDMIIHLLSKYSVEPNRAVFIDDTSLGLNAGKKAGTITVGITTGIDSVSTINQVGPDYIIGRLSELIPLLYS